MKKVSLKPLMYTLIMMAFVSFNSSCQKADDPNIVFTVFNKTLIAVSGSIAADSVDMNLDTKPDFRVGMEKTSTGDSSASIMVGIPATGFYIDSTQKVSSLYLIKPLNKNEAPTVYTPGVKEWSSYVYIDFKKGTELSGFAGSGDKFVPLFVNNPLTGKFHYGWIRVNISNDHNTLKIIDGAYSLIPEVPLKMGAK